MRTKIAAADDVVQETNRTEDWTDDQGEVRDLTAADFARMKRFSSLPADLQYTLREIQSGNVTVRPDAEEYT